MNRRERSLQTLLGWTCLTLLASPVSAQWSTNAAVNNAISERSEIQVRPKLAADGTGGTWIGWIDHASGGWETYVQHLDPEGRESFPHNGLLVSAYPAPPGNADWDLIADAQGACVFVLTDYRQAGLDVHAYRIETTGAFTWGPDGVPLSSNNAVESWPHVAQLTDGSYVFVWTRAATAIAGSVRMQRLDAAGVAQFPQDGLAITSGAGENPGNFGVVAALGGSFLVGWTRDDWIASPSRHLRVSLFDASGSALWPAHTTIYDTSTLRWPSVPVMESDGAGGAWVAWYRDPFSTPGEYSTFVQHVDANGVELCPHQGASVAPGSTRETSSPTIALCANGDLAIAYQTRGSFQWGIGAQRFSPTGAHMWGPTGVEIAPVDDRGDGLPQTLVSGDDVLVTWLFQPQVAQWKSVLAQRLDPAGTRLFPPAGLPVCSKLSEKERLVAGIDVSGVLRVAWQDHRMDGNDVYAQALNADGSLGPPTNVAAFCSGDGSSGDHSSVCPCGNTGATGHGCAHSFDPAGARLTSSGVAALDTLVLHSEFEPATSFTMFLQHASAGDTLFHDGVLCASGGVVRLRGRAAAGGEARFPDASFTLDATTTLSQRGGVFPGQGVRRYYAAWYRNAALSFCPPATANISNGIRVDW